VGGRGLEDLLRDLAPQVLGVLVRRYGQFDACEDATQEAMLQAVAQWPVEGVPASPRGWLVTVASRRLIDEMRSEHARRRRELDRAAEAPRAKFPDERGPDTDDSLTLLFLCCHPSLSGPSQIALMLLTDARRSARAGPDGRLIPLDEQDRTAWDRDRIAEGVALLSAALPRGQVGPYQVQAAIAAVHDEAKTMDATDWPQILGLYDLLERIAPSPLVTLNRAVAVAMVTGPAAGLAALGALDSDPRLATSHRLLATRAHLLEMSGDTSAAAAGFREAARRTTSLPERRYLVGRAMRLTGK
jgi:predicted RNA polymerase sigma factor